MPTSNPVKLSPLAQLTLDVAMYSAVGALPVGRLHGRQVLLLVTASAVASAAGTYLALRALERARTTTPDGWMPWTPHAAPGATGGDGGRPRGREDRAILFRRAAIAAVAGTVSAGVTAIGVAADRRAERFFTNRGARHPRLAVGLSQGVCFGVLTNVAVAIADSRDE
ncbi:hypothetical protein ACFQRD_15530 [Brachybacterium sp. GCM10030268]|uniref:hypothetical protein n=1 Tax=Brachybacterium sp. GCM10030268 TaxID=3273382 RepID=UPI00360A7257